MICPRVAASMDRTFAAADTVQNELEAWPKGVAGAAVCPEHTRLKKAPTTRCVCCLATGKEALPIECRLTEFFLTDLTSLPFYRTSRCFGSYWPWHFMLQLESSIFF